MATYTVPTTGVYDNSRTGGRFRHVAGAVIDLALAVDLGMPGAALPADPAPFTDAQAAYLAATEAAIDHTHAHAEGPNLIANGDFETDIDGWLGFDGFETLSHETGSPLTGVGSLKVVTTNGSISQGPIYPDTGHIAVQPGTLLRLRLRIKGNAPTLAITMNWNAASPTRVWDGVLLTSIAQVITVDNILVPAGNTGVNPVFGTLIAEVKTFYLDDVYLGLMP